MIKSQLTKDVRTGDLYITVDDKKQSLWYPKYVFITDVTKEYIHYFYINFRGETFFDRQAPIRGELFFDNCEIIRAVGGGVDSG